MGQAQPEGSNPDLWCGRFTCSVLDSSTTPPLTQLGLHGQRCEPKRLRIYFFLTQNPSIPSRHRHIIKIQLLAVIYFVSQEQKRSLKTLFCCSPDDTNVFCQYSWNIREHFQLKHVTVCEIICRLLVFIWRTCMIILTVLTFLWLQYSFRHLENSNTHEYS